MARKILLADDSVTAQNMGRKILADAGYDVVTVNNGSAALKRIAEIKPDLIVLDVYMPGYSGLEVCQRLKDSGETAHIPVLLSVGKLEPFKPDEARRVRADGHIVKPFEASELLTAITRLEDRMVPQQSEGARFNTQISGVERFGGEGSGWKAAGNPDADIGWKSRLRFPSKKKEDEPEAEDAAAGAAFRDFRKGKSKTGAIPVFAVKEPPPPGQEPGLVPDIPRDITPQELDALSALAAKLDGPIPQAENVVPLAEPTGPVEARAAELVAAEREVVTTEVAKAEGEVPAAAADAKEEEKTGIETFAPAVESGAAAVEATAFTAEAPASIVEAKSDAKIPIARVDLATENAAAVADAAAIETHPHEPELRATEQLETAVAAIPVNTAVFAQEPAPVDGNDEPLFASAASAIGQAPEDTTGEEVEAKPAKAVGNIEAAGTSAPAEAVAAVGADSVAEESKAQKFEAQEFRAGELTAEEGEQPISVVASAPEPAEAEEPAPSDEELAEALRLLTPATAHADGSAEPPFDWSLAAAGQLLAEEAAGNAAAGLRWVAEPVSLSPEESAISLEAEMFGAFAPMPAAISGPASGVESEPARITRVSAIEAAVENRLAEAGFGASSNDLAEQGAELCSSDVETPAEAIAAVSSAESPVVDGTEVEQLEAGERNFPAVVEEEAAEEEAAAATFADAFGRDEVETAPEQDREPIGEMAAAVAPAAVVEKTPEKNRDSSAEAGGEESMGKDVKSKSGKSNWHQIRTAPASAASQNDVVEAAKAAAAASEEAPKVMAAAAAAEASAPASASAASAPDAGTIASIVDSVLADLRPKIVEEIAKKLAGK